MRESIGSVFLYNIIIVFIVIVFAFLAGTVSYTKAFKVNSRIVKAIEIYEGYNSLSDKLITDTLNTIGYQKGTSGACPIKEGQTAISINGNSNQYKYCLYRFTVDKDYFTYGVVSYMYVDLPVLNKALKIPIYSKTERIFKF